MFGESRVKHGITSIHPEHPKTVHLDRQKTHWRPKKKSNVSKIEPSPSVSFDFGMKELEKASIAEGFSSRSSSPDR